MSEQKKSNDRQDDANENDQIVTRIHLDDTHGWQGYPADLEDIINGTPSAQFNMFRMQGQVTPLHCAMLLSIEPSKFKYRFLGDESWIVIKGQTTITLDDGQIVEMKPGDLISIKGGRDSVWEVHEHFLKFVVVSSAKK